MFLEWIKILLRTLRAYSLLESNEAMNMRHLANIEYYTKLHYSFNTKIRFIFHKKKTKIVTSPHVLQQA